MSPIRRRKRTGLRVPLTLAGLFGLAGSGAAQLPPPPVPPENPMTAEKVVLGKILFYEEQLSSSDTVACGTCHRVQKGGADPRAFPRPGPDGEPGNFDDRWGSPGVHHFDPRGHYQPDPVLGLTEQVTRRSTPSHIGSAYHRELGHDGSASTTFADPISGQTVIAQGGALESQSLRPILSTLEMSRPGRSWDDVCVKLQGAVPLRLASDLTPDLVNALLVSPDYPRLFTSAFGDPAVTPVRIAFALACYQRTLVADQTPFDLYRQGDPTALSQDEIAGLALFEGKARCVLCHAPPLFTNDDYHNTGLRPVRDDRGRQLVTGDPADAGKFKTPGLRNVGLRRRNMHMGRFPHLGDSVEFYHRGGYFHRHQDPQVVPLGLTEQEKTELRLFLQNGLSDPRVAGAHAPFDRPTLRSQRLWEYVRPFGGGQSGTGGIEPETVLVTPPHLGHEEFKVGLRHGLGGAPALLASSPDRGPPGQNFHGVPVHIALDPAPKLRLFTLEGQGAGAGHATHGYAIPDLPALRGHVLVYQWFVGDPGGVAGLAATAGVEIELF